MSLQPPQPGPGWWLAADGKWYPPAPPPQTGPVVPTPVPQHQAPPIAPANYVRTEVRYAVPTAQVPSKARTTTSTIGNVLWVVLAGFWLAIGYVLAGIVNMITIIGIPFGIQSFKLASYALWPFGRVVVERPNRDAGLSCLGNVLWFIFGGLWLALSHLLVGLLLCLTIIGIPLGLGSIKMAGLAIAPFGKQVVSRRQLASMPGVIIVSQIN